MIFECFVYCLIFLFICKVSLWVGVSINVCILLLFVLGFFDKCLINGSVKFVVLFVLVCVVVIILWFLMIVGIVCDWIGVGVL